MALPGAITHQDHLLTVNIDDNSWFQFSEGVAFKPLYIDRANGVWVHYGRFDPGTVLDTHYHTGVVHFFTTKGQWNYVEYPESPQVAGSYLFEPSGSVHTLSVPADATEPAEGFIVIYGSNVNFRDGEYADVTDAGSIEEFMFAAVRAGTNAMPKYIRGEAMSGPTLPE